MEVKGKTVGILAYQGSVAEHQAAFEGLKELNISGVSLDTLPNKTLGISIVLVKSPEDLIQVSHLVIPGGESSVIGDFLQSSGLAAAITEKFKAGRLAIWGTCAGAILLGRSSSPYTMNLIDVDVDRNAYGSQSKSFDTQLEVHFPNNKANNANHEGSTISLDSIESSEVAEITETIKTIPAIFVRAPKIAKIGGNVKVLASYEGSIVLCQEGRILISSFHPELTQDTSVQEYFLQI